MKYFFTWLQAGILTFIIGYVAVRHSSTQTSQDVTSYYDTIHGGITGGGGPKVAEPSVEESKEHLLTFYDGTVYRIKGSQVIAVAQVPTPFLFIQPGAEIPKLQPGYTLFNTANNGGHFILPPGYKVKVANGGYTPVPPPPGFVPKDLPVPKFLSMPFTMIRGIPCVPLANGGYAAIDTGGITLGIEETLKYDRLMPPAKAFKVEGLGVFKPKRDFLTAKEFKAGGKLPLEMCAKSALKDYFARGIKIILGRDTILLRHLVIEFDFPKGLVKFCLPDKDGNLPTDALFKEFPQSWLTCNNNELLLVFSGQLGQHSSCLVGLDTGWPGCSLVARSGQQINAKDLVNYNLCGYKMKTATSVVNDSCYLNKKVSKIFGDLGASPTNIDEQLWGGVALLLPFEQVVVDMPEGLVMASRAPTAIGNQLRRYQLYCDGIYVDTTGRIHQMQWLSSTWKTCLNNGDWKVLAFGNSNLRGKAIFINKTGKTVRFP